MACDVLIVGFGNTLMGDDGAGPAVIAALAGRLGARARAVDGGTDSLRLPSLWQGEGEVWLVDAVAAAAAPGTVHRLGHDEVVGIPQRHATAHQLSLPEGLRWLAHAYPELAAVRYRMWGIEVERTALQAGLSPHVVEAVRRVAEEIVAELERGSPVRADAQDESSG
jgi:hydrogenase maturation protease